MYNSGARLSEMTCLQRAQVKFDSTTYLQLHGKGRKERIVPLWAKTGRVLRSWFREPEGEATELAFPSVRGAPLSSDGLRSQVSAAGLYTKLGTLMFTVANSRWAVTLRILWHRILRAIWHDRDPPRK